MPTPYTDPKEIERSFEGVAKNILNVERHVLLLYFIGILQLLLVVAACFLPQADGASSRTCFPASHWDANQDVRPCAELTRVAEDGSFAYHVLDADGTIRYSGTVGAKDR